VTKGADLLTTFQVHVATVFFGLKASQGYVVAGGAGLLASDLIHRATRDIDLFASEPVTSVGEAKVAILRAMKHRRYDIELVHDSATFCRLIVGTGSEQVLVDLAIDSPPSLPPTVTLLGPTLAPLELGGRKLLALFGRAEARDFADVYVLGQRFGKDALIERAAVLDPGFDLGVLAQMMRTLSRFTDDEIPLPPDGLTTCRTYFASWSTELDTRPHG
jgi:hypothetical protein